MSTPNGTDSDQDATPQWTYPGSAPAVTDAPGNEHYHEHDHGPAGHLASEGHAGHEANAGHEAHAGHGGHGLMMIICCIPMLVIAGALFFTGAAGSGAIVGALLCTAMMASMMFMPGGHGGHGRHK